MPRTPTFRLTDEAVRKAIAEHDQLGPAAFHERYGFGEADDYFLLYEGRQYASKAIAIVAYEIQHGVRVTPGGEKTVTKALERLGFAVTRSEDWTATPGPMKDHLRALGTGTLHSFTTWKQDAGVPKVAVGVYTIWQRADAGGLAAATGPEKLVYVGYAGRSLAVEQATIKGKGLWDRLQAHTSGRRSGDQFAVYVADRWVLPSLSQAEIAAVAEGQDSMDRRVRGYIASYLGFRWIVTPDASTARKVEMRIRRGLWEHGKPLLNPSE